MSSYAERRISRRQGLQALGLIGLGFLAACEAKTNRSATEADKADYLTSVGSDAVFEALKSQFPVTNIEELKIVESNEDVGQLPEINTNQNEYLKKRGIQSFSLGYISNSNEFVVHIKSLEESKIGQTYQKEPSPWPSFLILSDTVINDPEKGALLKLSVRPADNFNFEIDPSTPNLDGKLTGALFYYPVEKDVLSGKDIIVAFAEDLINFNGQKQPKYYLPGIFRLSKRVNEKQTI